MHEPATTLTDYLLMLQCAYFVTALARRPAGFVRNAFVVVFAAVALASFAGGTLHGFFPDPGEAVHVALWLVTLLAIGVTSAAMIAVATAIGFPGAGRGTPVVLLLAGWLLYAATVVWVRRDFAVAIAAYLPAALYLMVVLAHSWRRRRAPGAVTGIAGVVLALLGAAGQQAGVALHPVHFDHNAVYHVVQAVALYLLYRTASEVGEPA
jgi:hypothetical protein